MLRNASSLTEVTTVVVCILCLTLTGCGSVENRAVKPPKDVTAESACILVQDKNWDEARRNFKSLRENILDSDLDRKFFISAKIGQLEKDSWAVSSGDFRRERQLNKFCEGVTQGVPLVELAEGVKTTNVIYNPSDYANGTTPESKNSNEKESNSSGGKTGQGDIGDTIKDGLRQNCTNLPPRFDFLRVQEREGTFNNYGEPLRLLTLGNLLLSVYDQEGTWRVGPFEWQSQTTLNDWECIFPFNVSAN